MTTKAGERLYELLDRVQPGPRGDVLRMGAIGSAIAAVEAEAVRDALTDLRAAVVATPRPPRARRAGDFLDRAAVLAEIDKRMPGAAT